MRSTIRSLIPPLVLLFPGSIAAQDAPPPNLAEVEMARSRACVGALADLAELQATLDPYLQRIDRLNALGRAVSLEKRQDAEPFENADPIEASVARWFQSDSALAVRLLEERDSSILVARASARTGILGQLSQRIQELSDTVQGRLLDGAAIQAAADPCVGAILIRSAVLEECGSRTDPVCDGARAEESQGTYLFVDDPDDLWGVESYGPWLEPTPIRIGADGGLAGASTSARARIGNVAINLTLRPLLSRRSELSEEEIAQYQANLGALGLTFDHPTFAMVPGIQLQGTLPPPLGGETHYLLHFGDLSGDDVIWSMEAGGGGPLRATFPATASDLARLQSGELVSLSAIRAPEDQGEAGEAVYTLSLLQIGQATNVGLLLRYFSDGSFERDLRALFPTGSGG